jgi:alkylated DNA nucleotide flippase Atl1
MAGSNALTTNALAPARCGDPKVMETGITHVVLQWPSSSEPDLDHYNVYASAGQDAVPSLATLVGSPKAAKFVDWGLQPGATYHYRVTSVDRQGNESVPGSSARATTKAVAAETVRIELEAEKGKCQPPMEVGKSSDASGGAYVHVPDAYSDGPYVIGGKLEFSFEVPADGVFDFWGRALGLDGGSNSFFVSLDGSTPANWGVPVPRQGEPRFMWHRISGLEGAPLRKGRHVLVVSSREDGTRIDKIVITNEPNAKFTD